MIGRRGTAMHLGFSLLEVLITLSVTAIALAALIQLQAALQRGGALARQYDAGRVLAGSQLERLRTTARIAGIRGLQTPPPTSVERNGTLYRQAVIIDGSTVPAAAQIVVTWSDSGGRQRSVRLVSLLNPRPPAPSGTIDPPDNAASDP